jgi:DMSO/TMAO reductase YedYZ heme-binding membrane subunit
MAGFAFGVLVEPVYRDRNFAWMVARATGVGAFLALGGLCVLGMWFRRPATRGVRVHPDLLLRLHLALAPATCALVAAHIVSLLADRYSGVRWAALLLPDGATYRPRAVTYGMLAADLMLIVIVTAALAGQWAVRAAWAPLHLLAYPAFALVWLHGVLAGSDTRVLEGLYASVGAGVWLVFVASLRRGLGPLRPRVPR